MNGIICRTCAERDRPIKAVEVPYLFKRGSSYQDTRTIWCCAYCDLLELWPHFARARR